MLKGCLPAWRASINSLRRISLPACPRQARGVWEDSGNLVKRPLTPVGPGGTTQGPGAAGDPADPWRRILACLSSLWGLDLTFDLWVNIWLAPTYGTQAVGIPGPEAPQE